MLFEADYAKDRQLAKLLSGFVTGQITVAKVVVTVRLVHIRPALKSALKIALSLNFQFEQNRA